MGNGFSTRVVQVLSVAAAKIDAGGRECSFPVGFPRVPGTTVIDDDLRTAVVEMVRPPTRLSESLIAAAGVGAIARAGRQDTVATMSALASSENCLTSVPNRNVVRARDPATLCGSADPPAPTPDRG